MNRELLEKAKELDEKISKIEFILKMDKESLFFYVGVEDHTTSLLNYKSYLPNEINDEVIDILKRYKQMYEQQLEEL